jgi:hypothetical protein
MAVAENEREARQLAAENDPYGIDWNKSEQISCEGVRVYGDPAPDGFVPYQVVEA